MDAVAADGGNHGDAGADDADDDDGDDDCCSSTCQLDIDILIITCEPCGIHCMLVFICIHKSHTM